MDGPSRARSPQPEADLRYSSLTRIVLFGNVDLAARFKQSKWAHNLFLNGGVYNLLDDRIRVRDRLGHTPNGDQPAFLDPVGRTVSIQLRKLF